MDPGILFVALAAGLIGLLLVSARRAVTVAELEVDRGVVRVLRGGVAPPVLADLRDVAARPPVRSLRIRIVRSRGRAEVQLTGSISDEQALRLRNVIGSVPLARLANAPRRR